MDFRQAPHPGELSWLPPTGFGKTKTAAATYGGKKIVIQTPVCRTRMFKDPRSTTLYLSLSGGNHVHEEFEHFIESLEKHAASLPHAEHLELSSCLRNGSMRLTAWDDVQWFDHDGMYLKEAPKSIDSCACTVEFGGCWVTDQKWGLRWSIKQIRLSASAPIVSTPVAEYAFLD
jgi:hypothetical protein